MSVDEEEGCLFPSAGKEADQITHPIHILLGAALRLALQQVLHHRKFIAGGSADGAELGQFFDSV
jgi:hypothetical protein